MKNPILISDLLDIVHATIIKEKGKNDIILKELIAIDEKIKKGSLINYEVNDNTLFKSMIYRVK